MSLRSPRHAALGASAGPGECKRCDDHDGRMRRSIRNELTLLRENVRFDHVAAISRELRNRSKCWRRRLSVTCAYFVVEAIDLWPIASFTSMRSAPAFS